MGGVESTEGGIQGVDGLQVGSLLPRSPAHQAGLIPFFDFIVKVDSHEQKEGSTEAFREYLKKNKGNNVKLTVYNSKVMALREVTLVPDNTWGGNGLVGCSLEWGNTTMSWHVSAVAQGSPAEGSLIAGEDYIIGAEKDPTSTKPVITLFCDDSDFHSRIAEKMSLRLSREPANDRLLLLVYSNKDNSIREEYISLGTSTALGIDVGNGYLHNIQPGKVLPVMKRFINLDASVSKVTTESIVMNDSSPSQTPSATPKAVQQPAAVPSPVQPSQQLQQQLLQQQRKVGEDHFNTLLKQKEDQLLQRDRENEELRKLLVQQQEQERLKQLSQPSVASLHTDPQPMSQQEIAAARVSELMGGTSLTSPTAGGDPLAAPTAAVPPQQPPINPDFIRQLQEEKETAERLMRQQEEQMRQQQEEAEKQREAAMRAFQEQQKQQQLEAEQRLEAERARLQQQQAAIEAERLKLQELQKAALEEASLRSKQDEAESQRQREIEAAQQTEAEAQKQRELAAQQAQEAARIRAQEEQQAAAAQQLAAQQAQLAAQEAARIRAQEEQQVAAAQQLAAQQAQQEVERLRAQEQQQALEMARAQQAMGSVSLGGSPAVGTSTAPSSQMSSPYTPHSPGKGATPPTGGFNTATGAAAHHSALSSLTHSPTPSSSASQTARRSSLVTEDYSLQDPSIMSFPMYGA